MSYKEKINDIADSISPDIIDLSIKRQRGRPPTQAFSDFLTHSEQGDWAENLFFNSLRDSDLGLVPVMYGKADKIIAGDAGFKDFYNQYQDELDLLGKRPDILLFDPEIYKKDWGDSVGVLSAEQLADIVPLARAGFEVRSSSYLTRRFVAKNDRPFLSFTPKVEDILVVLKWIDTFDVPHFYVQVFFDAVYAISFAEILSLLKDCHITQKGKLNKKIIGSKNGEIAFVIEKNPKNQFKETIHIFLNNGHRLGEDVVEPELLAHRKELAGGRLLHHVSFKGGSVSLDTSGLKKLIEQEA